MTTKLSISPTAILLLLALSCGQGGDDANQGISGELLFEVTVGEAPFSCNQTFEGVGISGANAEIADFRFYVHQIEVIDEQGESRAVEIVDDGKWQSAEVALLDFTDGTGNCANTSGEENRAVQVLIPQGQWVGIRFRLGVPFEKNHIDMSTANAPLNLPSMFWSWNAGYKFLRLDMPTEQNPAFRFHLGSTRCQPAAGGGVSHCDYPNRPVVELSQFDMQSQLVRFDLAAMLATTDVDHHTEHTPQGCMSTEDDPDCQGLFDVLGLIDDSLIDDSLVASDVFTARQR